MTVDTKKYTEFVDAVTSQESKDYISFNSRCFGIQSVESGDGLPVHRLLTAALGMSAESGEFTEVSRRLFSKVNQLMKRISSI